VRGLQKAYLDATRRVEVLRGIDMDVAPGESVAIVGTPFTLNYSSARVPGRAAVRTLRIPLTGPSIPASLKRVNLDIQIGGRSFQQTTTAAANAQAVFQWDGLDAYGRAMQGIQQASVTMPTRSSSGARCAVTLVKCPRPSLCSRRLCGETPYRRAMLSTVSLLFTT